MPGVKFNYVRIIIKKYYLFNIIILLLITLLSVSCNNSETRSFYLAAAPCQFEVTETNVRIIFDFSGFQDNIDLVSLHLDNFFGLPWDEFSPGGKLGEPWHEIMNQIKEAVDELNVGVYLSLTPISGMRNSIAAKAVDNNGILYVDDNWYNGCYNFNNGPNAKIIRNAYLSYVRWMVDFFKPVFLTHCIEINMYMDSCPDCYESLIRLLNEVYYQEKSINPDLPIFPTFTANGMWSFGDDGNCNIGDRTCLIANLEKQKNIQRDRFGISAYPIFLQWEWDQIPEDYFSTFSELTGERIVFGETGQGSHNVTIPWPNLGDPCFTILRSSDEDQISYLEFVFNQANNLSSDLVVWWSLRDYLFKQILTSCPCNAPGLWCVLYNEISKTGLLGAWLMWGSMGVLNYYGEHKQSYSNWKEWLQRKIE